MRTYHALLAEKYGMRVRQYVLYLGRNRPRMESCIPKLDEDVKQVLNIMPFKIDVTQDAFYKEGFEQGEAKGVKLGEERGVTKGEARKGEMIALNMLRRGGFSDEEIVGLTGVSMKRLQELKAFI